MKRSSSKETLKLSALIKHSEDGVRQLINHTYATLLPIALKKLFSFSLNYYTLIT